MLSLFAAGLGPTRPGLDLGQPLPASPFKLVNSPVEVTVNGNLAELLYASGYPGAVDRYQVGFQTAPLQASQGSVYGGLYMTTSAELELQN